MDLVDNKNKKFKPIALRKAKIVCNFGLSECYRVKKIDFLKISLAVHLS